MVKLRHVKTCIGFSLVLLHLLAMLLCFLWLKPRMNLQSFQITALILAPVTSIYALAYIKEVARHMRNPTADPDYGQPIDVKFAVLAVLFTLAFSTGIIYAIYSYAFENQGQNPDDLKLTLSIIETALGVFMGLIFETLFGKSSLDQATSITDKENKNKA